MVAPALADTELRLSLPGDVLLIPVERLSAQVREGFTHEAGDVALTRVGSRVASRIVDAQAASLLEEFRTPTTIVDAVIRYSRASAVDPEEALDQAFPLLQKLRQERILTGADSEEAEAIRPTLAVGGTALGCEVLGCVQVLEDTELYRVQSPRGLAALKLLRPGHGREVRRMLDRETVVLRHLDGRVNPALLGAGSLDGQPYLLLDWCAGRLVTAASPALRREGSAAGRMALLDLCCKVVEAYAHLHAQQVTHGDVHPGNILVDGDGVVKIIDFGLARMNRRARGFREPNRGGVPFYYEPEYAHARRKDQPPPRASKRSDQHALAALVYHLLTGSHYLNFSLEKREMYRQIAQDPPLPFAEAHAAPWPEVEEALAVALSKDCAKRHVSVAEFAARLRSVAAPPAAAVPVATERPATGEPLPARAGTDAPPSTGQRDEPGEAALEATLESFLARVGPGGALFEDGLPTAPTASVNYGAAGIAYALYRIAGVREDAALLSLADVWAERAAAISTHAGFYNDATGLTPEIVGRISIYHTPSGAHCVQALIGHARGDMVSQDEANRAFVAASQRDCDNLDLTLGLSSTLLGCTFLHDAIPPQHVDLNCIDAGPLVALGDATLDRIWSAIDRDAPLGEYPTLRFLGMAHGWAGLIYATLLWCRSAGRPIPATLPDRLEQLVHCAETESNGGVRFRRRLSRQRPQVGDYGPSWCNGTAGMVFLWTLAHRTLGDDRYLDLARRSALNAWQDDQFWGSLCCGLSGRAYALLNLHRCTGERLWLDRAQTLARRATAATAATGECRDSLYKGDPGVAVLAADLRRPGDAVMPLFEPEGWPMD